MLTFCRCFISRVPKNYGQKEVGEQAKNLRLDQYLRDRGVKWDSLHKKLRNKYYFVVDAEGNVVKEPGYRLKPTDSIYYPNNSELFQHEQSSDFYKIDAAVARPIVDRMTIFENKHIIVLNKEGGYATQGGQDYHKNIFTLLISCYDRSSVHIMHRLDSPCTGLVMLAKSPQAARLIQPIITGREAIHKFYVAEAQNRPTKKEGLIDCNVEWNDNKRKARLCSPTIKDSKHAFTYFKTIKQGDTTLYLLKLMTGRKHQLRCHLSQYLNTPIVDDRLYGSKTENETIRLHSYAMILQNEQVVKDIFQGQTVQNAKGRVEYRDGSVRVYANPPWEIPKIDDRIIGRMVAMRHQVQSRKHIVY